MTATLFVLNEAPYGSERAYNGLRLAGALGAREGQQVRVFLMADAVGCAKSGQRVPEGYYNVQLMLGKVLRAGEVGLCGTCMDARGMAEAEMVDGAKRSTLRSSLIVPHATLPSSGRSGRRRRLQKAPGWLVNIQSSPLSVKNDATVATSMDAAPTSSWPYACAKIV